MPSAPSYKRNYKEEEKTAKQRGETGGHNSGHSLRLRARRLEMKKGAVKPHDGKDVDHIKPIVKGGGGSESNLRVESAHDNRSYPRTKKAGMK